jgi:hypothetical protein
MPKKIEITTDLAVKVKELFEQEIGTRKIAKLLNVSRHIVNETYKVLGVSVAERQQPRRVYKMIEKSCATCNQIKPVDQFRKRIGQYADGTERISYESSCSECEAIYNNEKAKAKFPIRNKNPNFRIRRSISHFIWRTLNNNNSSKDGESCLKYLGYSIEELKIHLENQFEPWMIWDNHGKYIKSQWNDNDQDTWTWNIDHIIPQSDLPYSSMEDDNFKKCWALTNLRPLSSKQNNIDGTNKLRHNKAA